MKHHGKVISIKIGDVVIVKGKEENRRKLKIGVVE
jgi:hypothetical protein